MLQCVLKTHTFAPSLCCRQKALLELHSASGQLCACVLSKALVNSVSVYNSHSLHTLTHMLPPSPSVTFSLFVFLYILISLFAYFSLLMSFFLSPVLWPRDIMQSYQKRIVSHACLCLRATRYSFQQLPFLLCDLQS